VCPRSIGVPDRKVSVATYDLDDVKVLGVLDGMVEDGAAIGRALRRTSPWRSNSGGLPLPSSSATRTAWLQKNVLGEADERLREMRAMSRVVDECKFSVWDPRPQGPVTPLRTRLVTHFGMRETPLPMATRLTIVWSFSLSCTTFGSTSDCRQISISES